MSNRLLFFAVMAAVLLGSIAAGEFVARILFPQDDTALAHIISVSLSALIAFVCWYVIFKLFPSVISPVGGETLSESAKVHRFFVDNIDDGAFLIENAIITDVSKVSTDLLGYTREELIGQSPYFVVSDAFKDSVRKHVQAGDEASYEAEALRKDGTTFPINVHGRELTYDGRRVRLTTIRDISERKRTEETLRKLSRAVEQSPSAVFITNTKGIIEYVNTKFTEITGYTAEDAIGQTPRLIRANDTLPSVHADLWKTISSGKEWRHEIKDRCKDGSTFWAYSIIAPVKNEANEITHYVATHEDITRRKNAEEAASAALKNADIANRAKSELLANMSHELRTPLNAIIGFSDSINSEIFGPLGHRKYSEYVVDIYNSGVHLLELVNDILDVSAIEAGRLELHQEEVDIASLVSACTRLIRHRANEGEIQLDTIIDDNLPSFYADERRMKQVLLNLLTNAVKFTPKDGKVRLYVKFDANAFVFTVSDTGIGMSAVEVEKAMTQFGQVDSTLARKHEGSGLGLPLTKGLVELHGGTLEIQSEKGVGTEVIASIPLKKNVAVA